MASTSDQTTNDKWLLARVEDAVEQSTRTHRPQFIGFLDECQAATVSAWLHRNSGDAQWLLWGGHEEAQRVVLGVFDSNAVPSTEAFPLVSVAFSYRSSVHLTHRDVLGSLIGCGIVREKIGDIACADGLAVAFIRRELAAFVAENLTTIGREGVTCPFDGDVPPLHTFKPISGTLASARLDATLKVLLGLSREKACELIRAALVSINHQPCRSVSAALKAGDILSVKGSGRFVIDDLSDTTAKGRLILKARKYI